MANKPNNLIERIPGRPGFVRRVVRADEMDHMLETGWDKVKAAKDDRYKDNFSDQVADKLYAVEIPEEDYKQYARDYMGGLQNEKIMANINRFKKDAEGGEESMVQEKNLPPQAFLKRKGE